MELKSEKPGMSLDPPTAIFGLDLWFTGLAKMSGHSQGKSEFAVQRSDHWHSHHLQQDKAYPL